MKLSDKTIETLKNFSVINSFIALKAGKVQKTISPEKIVYGKAELDDEFPVDFAVYDLNQFLGVISTLENYDLEFTEDVVTVTDGKFVLHYRACSPNIGVSPSDNEVDFGASNAAFKLEKTDFKKLLNLAASLDLNHLVINASDEGVFLSVKDIKNDTSNDVSINVGDHDGEEFTVVVNTDNLKIILDDYDVEVYNDQFIMFTNKEKKRTYIVALEVED